MGIFSENLPTWESSLTIKLCVIYLGILRISRIRNMERSRVILWFTSINFSETTGSTCDLQDQLLNLQDQLVSKLSVPSCAACYHLVFHYSILETSGTILETSDTIDLGKFWNHLTALVPSWEVPEPS